MSERCLKTRVRSRGGGVRLGVIGGVGVELAQCERSEVVD